MGILDFLQTPEAQLGIGLLAAGGPSTTPMSVGQRVQSAMQGMNAQQQNALKTKLLESQIAENNSQNAVRQSQIDRQARQDAYYLGTPGATPAAAGPAVATPGAATVPGAALKAAVGKTPDAPDPPQGKFAEWSQKYKIPVDALVADYYSNGGKGIAEMIVKRGSPDMQVSNGFAYDKNTLGAGYLPQLNISSNGQATQVQIGPDGQPVVSAPRGAVDAFSAYKGAEANLKPIKIFNPQTQREEFTSEGAVVAPMAGPRGNVQSSGYAGGDRNGANAESIRMIQSELTKPGNSPADTQAMQREIQRLQQQSGLAPQPGNFAAGPSATEAATAEANKVRMVDTAKADVVRDTGKTAEGKRAAQVSQISNLASQLLDQGPTASGVGSLVDSAANFVGQPLKGGTKAQQLEALSGWLVSNVPRMEGPQSNADVLNYQTMAGRVGDRTLPVEARKAALGTLMELQRKYAEAGAETTAPNPAKPAKVLDALPTANASNKGQRIRDTTTGKVLVSNGIQWKEE
jgi:hypothetical protein